MKPLECAKKIKEKKRAIDQLKSEIDDIAKEHIDDFHFLDYQVSTFWGCDKSPIGMCLFPIVEVHGSMRLTLGNCRYCGDSAERK